MIILCQADHLFAVFSFRFSCLILVQLDLDRTRWCTCSDSTIWPGIHSVWGMAVHWLVSEACCQHNDWSIRICRCSQQHSHTGPCCLLPAMHRPVPPVLRSMLQRPGKAGAESTNVYDDAPLGLSYITHHAGQDPEGTNMVPLALFQRKFDIQQLQASCTKSPQQTRLCYFEAQAGEGGIAAIHGKAMTSPGCC